MWFLLACTPSNTKPPEEVTPPPSLPAEVAPPVTSVAPVPTNIPISTSVGVPECDAYLERYRACVGAMPQPERLLDAVDQMRDTWVLAATAEGGRERLATACAEMTLPPGCS